MRSCPTFRSFSDQGLKLYCTVAKTKTGYLAKKMPEKSPYQTYRWRCISKENKPCFHANFGFAIIIAEGDISSCLRHIPFASPFFMLIKELSLCGFSSWS